MSSLLASVTLLPFRLPRAASLAAAAVRPLVGWLVVRLAGWWRGRLGRPHIRVQFAWWAATRYQRLHTIPEVGAVFVQQTMKIAARTVIAGPQIFLQTEPTTGHLSFGMR